MKERDTKRELETLLEATQKNREELKKSWKRVEDLDAAIQSAKSDQQQRKQTQKPG
jgi:hypothetical protein